MPARHCGRSTHPAGADNRTHPPCGSHPPLTSSGCSCTVGRGGFPHRYKPSSLLRPYIADTSALSMLELGLMPVVTTMSPPPASALAFSLQSFPRNHFSTAAAQPPAGLPHIQRSSSTSSSPHHPSSSPQCPSGPTAVAHRPR